MSAADRAADSTLLARPLIPDLRMRGEETLGAERERDVQEVGHDDDQDHDVAVQDRCRDADREETGRLLREALARVDAPENY